MNRLSIGIAAACLFTLACKQDPARSVKIVEHPAQVASVVTATSTALPDPVWYKDSCPPPPEDATGPSSLTVSGPCTFEHQSAVKCESAGDDFIIGLVRKALHGATMAFYINVENYHGPGSYGEAQTFVALESGKAIYRWSNDYAHATVGPDEAYLDLSETRLEEEPMLVDCTRMIGPASNFQYQCAPSSHFEETHKAPEILSGRLMCEEPEGKKSARNERGAKAESTD